VDEISRLRELVRGKLVRVKFIRSNLTKGEEVYLIIK